MKTDNRDAVLSKQLFIRFHTKVEQTLKRLQNDGMSQCDNNIVHVRDGKFSTSSGIKMVCFRMCCPFAQSGHRQLLC